jgi:hypothetical protein
MQKYRASKKMLPSSCNVTSNVTVTDCNQTEVELEGDKELEVGVVGKETTTPPAQIERPAETQMKIVSETTLKTKDLIVDKSLPAQNERVILQGEELEEWIKLRYRHWFNKVDPHFHADIAAVQKEIMKTYTTDISQEEVLKTYLQLVFVAPDLSLLNL